MRMPILDVVNKKDDYDWLEKKTKRILESLEGSDEKTDTIMINFFNQYNIEIEEYTKFWKLIHNAVAQEYMKYLNALSEKIDVEGVSDEWVMKCLEQPDNSEKW